MPFTIIGEIHRSGQPSVKVDQFYREGGSKSPCKWGSGSGIYTKKELMKALHAQASFGVIFSPFENDWTYIKNAFLYMN